jgi:outer membrane lipoprotein-sorting protein
MMRTGLFVMFLLLSGALFAQQDAKAKEILDKLSQTTRSYKSIQIDFSFTLENKAANVKETNEGWVALKDKSYRLHMPALGMEVFCDGTTVWSYLTDANEVNVTENDPAEEGSLNPANIFTIYEKGFKFTYIGEEAVNGKTAQVIDLFPVDKTKEFTKVRLYVDKAKSQILKAITYNKDNNTYTLVMKTMKTDQITGDDYFKFNKAKYPGVEVNDMR